MRTQKIEDRERKCSEIEEWNRELSECGVTAAIFTHLQTFW